jgi:hypothetical protein
MGLKEKKIELNVFNLTDAVRRHGCGRFSSTQQKKEKDSKIKLMNSIKAILKNRNVSVFLIFYFYQILL